VDSSRVSCLVAMNAIPNNTPEGTPLIGIAECCVKFCREKTFRVRDCPCPVLAKFYPIAAARWSVSETDALDEGHLFGVIGEGVDEACAAVYVEGACKQQGG
jgi:hypothetical protein